MDTGDSFCRVKMTTPIHGEVKNAWSYISISLYVFMFRYLLSTLKYVRRWSSFRGTVPSTCLVVSAEDLQVIRCSRYRLALSRIETPVICFMGERVEAPDTEVWIFHWQCKVESASQLYPHCAEGLGDKSVWLWCSAVSHALATCHIYVDSVYVKVLVICVPCRKVWNEATVTTIFSK